METQYLLWSLALGAMASLSLPLGSALGLLLRPSLARAALLAAFGAGALIAALSIELVAPALEEAAEAMHHGAGPALFIALIGGALAGGVVFVAFDRLLATRGAFLRKASTAMAWFSAATRDRQRGWLQDLCAIPLLRALPPEQVALLVRDVQSRRFRAGEMLLREGEAADELFFLRSGELELRRGDEAIETLGAGGIVGELPLLAEIPHSLSAVATREGEVLVLHRQALEHWRSLCPEFDRGLGELAGARLLEVRRRDARKSEAEQRWGERAVAALRAGHRVPSPAEVRRASQEHPGAPLAVWLGLLLDGVPESITLGAGFLAMLTASAAAPGEPVFSELIPYTLVAGVFLSNLPEALSSSLGMRAQGWGNARVLGIWSLLLLLTALATSGGYLAGAMLSHTSLAAIEGFAAGAALTAVIATMIPEAVHLAGSGGRVGLAALAGFLAAASFKLLE